MSILIVDDEEWTVNPLMQVLNDYANKPTAGTKRALRQQTDHTPVQCEYYSSVDDAIAAFARQDTHDPYRALITDFNMDGLNGKQVLTIFRGIYDGQCVLREEVQSFDEIREIDEEIADSLEDHFRDFDQYQRQVAAHEHAPAVLFSSQQYGDGHRDGILRATPILYVQKPKEPGRVIRPGDPEYRIRDHLIDEGAFSLR